MISDTFSLESRFLKHTMIGKIYGKTGQPILAFPTQNGRYSQFEDFGMVSVLSDYIQSGRIQLFACDHLYWEEWKANEHMHDRIVRHDQYCSYIAEELIPWIHQKRGDEKPLLAIGCSMGGYHASNMFFRRPDLFSGLISLSGWYTPQLFMDDYMESLVYFHSPLHFVSNMEDEYYLNLYRRAVIVLCCGRGAWEEERLRDMREMAQVLSEKHVPAWADVWGTDVGHDWSWWRVQLPYFMQYALKRLEDE